MKKPRDLYVCQTCGSRHVERCYWMRINTGEIMRVSKLSQKAWCPACKNTTVPILEDEYNGRKR